MTRPPQQLPLSHLLGLGFRQSVSLAPATLSLAAARALGAIALTAITWSLVEFLLAGQAAVGVGVAAGLGVLWLMAELVEGVVLAGALRQGRARMLGLPVPPILDAIVLEARRGLTFPLWLGVLQLFQSLWRWGALLGGLTLYVRAFEGRGSGLLASLALALAIVLPLLLGLLLLVWLRVGLVQAIHEDQSVSVGLFEATGLLRAGAGLPLLVILLFGLFALFGEGLVTTVVAPLSGMSGASPLTLMRLAWLSSLMAVGVSAIPTMIFEHAGWQGLMGWRLGGSGMLPPESLPAPRPVRVVQAGPALAGAGAGTGPVFDALPVAEPLRSGAPERPAPQGFSGDEGIVEALPAASASTEASIVQATPVERTPPSGEYPIVQATPIAAPGGPAHPHPPSGGEGTAGASGVAAISPGDVAAAPVAEPASGAPGEGERPPAAESSDAPSPEDRPGTAGAPENSPE